MSESVLFDEIKDYLISLGFSMKDSCFSIKYSIPGRTIIINGIRKHEQDSLVNFDIISLGEGATLDNDNVPISELQGYNIGDNDIWVETLEDFKFWIENVFQISKIC